MKKYIQRLIKDKTEEQKNTIARICAIVTTLVIALCYILFLVYGTRNKESKKPLFVKGLQGRLTDKVKNLSDGFYLNLEKIKEDKK